MICTKSDDRRCTDCHGLSMLIDTVRRRVRVFIHAKTIDLSRRETLAYSTRKSPRGHGRSRYHSTRLPRPRLRTPGLYGDPALLTVSRPTRPHAGPRSPARLLHATFMLSDTALGSYRSTVVRRGRAVDSARSRIPFARKTSNSHERTAR